MSGEDKVLAERRGKVLVITLNRPDARNALDNESGQRLCELVDLLDRDDDLSAGVLTGTAPGFSAGMDLHDFLDNGVPPGLGRFLRDGSIKPMVAAVEGFALAGGLEVALTCDLLVASRGAKLGIPEVGVGLFAAGGALLHLPRRMPYGAAMQLALTGEPIRAERAHEVGLVDCLAEPGSALDEALALAERIAANAPLAVVASKQVLRNAHGRTEAAFWEMQAEHQARVFSSQDAEEGPQAFFERRPPRWANR